MGQGQFYVYFSEACVFEALFVLFPNQNCCDSSYRAVGCDELNSVESGQWRINAVTLKFNKWIQEREK